MNTYVIKIYDRNYTKYNYEQDNLIRSDMTDNPIKYKLFNNDRIDVNYNIINSPTRCSEITGILVLEKDMTYGRKNGKGKLLYRCIPNDTSLPIFLIPYENKHNNFSKVNVNHYITFKFDSWEDKHPLGIINQNIGRVDIDINFYSYQLYCKQLNFSMKQFTNDTRKALELFSHDDYIKQIQKKYNIEDRTMWNVFSIDPVGSMDFDDAYSIKQVGEDILLSIYISNVTLWIDVLNLWESFTNRTSTIYLPNGKKPMLPSILSDGICSLKENQQCIDKNHLFHTL